MYSTSAGNISFSRLSTDIVVTRTCLAQPANAAGTPRSHIASMPTMTSVAPPDSTGLEANRDCSDSIRGAPRDVVVPPAARRPAR
jgi:hypothetical protein